MAVIQSVIPRDDYSWEIIMTNHNRLLFHMMPYLDTVQFCPLRDTKTWKHVEIADTSLNFFGVSKVEISMDMFLDLFQRDKNEGRDSMIDTAKIDKEGRLRIVLMNENWVDMDITQLVQYPMFSPLIQNELLKTLDTNKSSLVWNNGLATLEVSIHTLLNYFL